MLKIRLRRMGTKKAPFYRIVVSDSRSTPTGRFVETVGYYDPGTRPSTVRIDIPRTEGWIRHGAMPSATVQRLLTRAKTAESAAVSG